MSSTEGGQLRKSKVHSGEQSSALRPLAESQRPCCGSTIDRPSTDRLADHQTTFERTGGLHAAALFDAAGEITLVREDVGRHNAVDKVIGSRMLNGSLPLDEYGLLVSGRVAFEIVHKARRAGIALIAAIGAPSSLAVAAAQASDITLVGFLRSSSLNIYTGAARLSGGQS